MFQKFYTIEDLKRRFLKHKDLKLTAEYFDVTAQHLRQILRDCKTKLIKNHF